MTGCRHTKRSPGQPFQSRAVISFYLYHLFVTDFLILRLGCFIPIICCANDRLSRSGIYLLFFGLETNTMKVEGREEQRMAGRFGLQTLYREATTESQHVQRPIYRVQAWRSGTSRIVITALFLGVGGCLLWYGCNSLPADSGFVGTVTPSMTTTFSPTSTLTATPTVTRTVTPTLLPSPAPTPTPDLRVLNPANQHLYLYVKERKTWHAARDYCASQGGHLVTIQVPSENRFVYNLATDNVQRGTWLGASDEAQEGKWVWVTGEPWNYWNWAQGRKHAEPNDKHGDGSSGADFLFFDYWSRTWVDWRDEEAYFVCEWEPVSP